MQSIRPAAVAGRFYPADSLTLAGAIDVLLTEARTPTPVLTPKALIVPHAGYIYSGAVAASAYVTLKPVAGRIRRVVLLGPTHRVAVHGLALSGADAFATPLGEVALDLEAARLITALPQVVSSPQAHAQEHALEVQLPFLQTLLPDFKLLPLAVGMASAEEVAEVLEILWGGEETLIVISSDLSHFLPYQAAKQQDGSTAEAILQLRQPLAHQQACGGTPINGLLLAARHHQLTPHLLDLCNSGDTAGSKERVVGYGAFAFTTVPAAAQDDQAAQDEQNDPWPHGDILLKLARNAIAAALGLEPLIHLNAPWLSQPGATFVTLKQNGTLRGCIGSLAAQRALGEDVRANAVAAAFRDPRFVPLQADELNRTRIEVSQLTPAQPLQFADEREALAQLHPGEDGVIFEYGQHRSTFLPQVWEQLPSPVAFITQLKQKAGLPGDFWAAGVKLSRYGVKKWQEN